ncbi:hypothetical protein FQN55_004791 [Onygenales sp. PD_40]|nr:hypothetical protein FQN55_004791 [Onygenales sp. PD_40]
MASFQNAAAVNAPHEPAGVNISVGRYLVVRWYIAANINLNLLRSAVEFVDETDEVCQSSQDPDECSSPDTNKAATATSFGYVVSDQHSPCTGDSTGSRISVKSITLSHSVSPRVSRELPAPTSRPYPTQILPAQSLLSADRRVSLSSPGHDLSFFHKPSAFIFDQQQAYLLRHFIDNVACFFDFCDSERHFAREVPQRAKTCRTLRNAVLALSARHLSRTGEFDPFVSDRYYQECLKTLIPSLNDEAATSNDELLASTVILRLLEEFDGKLTLSISLRMMIPSLTKLAVPIVGSDPQGHSFGTLSFIKAQDGHSKATGLRQAAFWAGLRQDIFLSLTLHRSPGIQHYSHHCNIDRSLASADDCTWACRAVVHCADVLQFAFGRGPRSVAAHTSLKEYNLNWRKCRPPSFNPLFSNESDARSTETFPDIRLHSDWHVMGVQYLLLAYTLLLAHDPTLPRDTPRDNDDSRVVDDEIKCNVRKLCGIGLSNTSTPAGIFMSCMGISSFSHWFFEPREQQNLLDVLVRTEKMHGWPTVVAQNQVKQAWSRP